jgi:hypothetical protein
MRTWRRCGAAILLGGGWLLMFNKDPNAPNAPLSKWKEMDSFDTIANCQQGLLEATLDLSKEQSHGEVPKSDTLQPLSLRFRCERREVIEGLKPKSK